MPKRQTNYVGSRGSANMSKISSGGRFRSFHRTAFCSWLGPGQRVVDIDCGVGDVAMLACGREGRNRLLAAAGRLVRT